MSDEQPVTQDSTDTVAANTHSETELAAMTTLREALNDSEHRLNRAAWLLFKTVNTKLLDRWFGDAQRDVMLECCNLVLAVPELFEDSSLGGGNAPANAMEVAIHWREKSLLPALLSIFDTEYDDDQLIETVEKIVEANAEDPQVVTHLLEFGANTEHWDTALMYLSDTKPVRDEVIDYMHRVIEKALSQPDTPDWILTFGIEQILYYDPSQADYIEELVEKQQYDEDNELRGKLLEYVQFSREEQAGDDASDAEAPVAGVNPMVMLDTTTVDDSDDETDET